MIDLLPRLRRFAYALCGNLDDADDLVQATCERVIGNFDQWRPGSRLDCWMFAILRNAYLDVYRGRDLRARRAAEVEMTRATRVDGQEAAEASILLGQVQALLARTSEDQRSALLLALVEGLSYEEIAAIQEVPVGTVSSRIGRARQALRDLIASDEETGTEGARRVGTDH